MMLHLQYIMPERKVWSEDEDKILKLLREERGEKKWANIARIMQQEFGLAGRTGKQCRERYHNHLDSSIVNSEWNEQQQHTLYDMHEEVGNKWSLIAQKLPGRSDNCVKNHFYSKLRKAFRKLNKIIHDFFQGEYALLKESVLSKIIKTTQSKFKSSSKIDEQLADFCNGIKNRLFSFSFQQENSLEEVETAKQLIADIQHFDKDYKKGYKGLKFEYELEYLKPPLKSTLKKKASSSSIDSDRSESSFSYLSSSSLNSSCSDLSDMDLGEQMNKGSNTTGNISGVSVPSSGHSVDVTARSQQFQPEATKVQIKKQMSQNGRVIEGQSEGVMQVESFAQEYEQLLERDYYYQSREENIHFSNIYYDNTPVIARIFGPSDLESMELFGHKEEQDADLQFKMDNMEL